MTDSPAAALARDEALVEEPAGLVQRDLEGGEGGGQCEEPRRATRPLF